MAGSARVEIKMSVTGPTGIDGPLDVFFTQAVTRWTGKRVMTLATGITDQLLIDIGTGGIATVAQLALVSDQNISIKFGATGSNVAITVLANAPILLSGIAQTLVYLSNASGNTANITYMLASLL
jgi:hypothetical protein